MISPWSINILIVKLSSCFSLPRKEAIATADAQMNIPTTRAVLEGTVAQRFAYHESFQCLGNKITFWNAKMTKNDMHNMSLRV